MIASTRTVPDPVPAAGGFVGVPPARLLDTRIQHPCLIGSVRAVKVAGVGGVPTNAAAVALNVTAVDAYEPGYLTVWPSGQPKPSSSSVNHGTTAAIANTVIMRVGSGGQVNVAASTGCPQVIVDVMGWYAGGSPAAGGFAGVAPARLWDTRKQPPCVGSVRQVKVAGVGGVPANAGAVALNVTAVDAAASGYLTVWPSGQTRPGSSNLNYRSTEAVANAVVMRVGSGGFVNVAASRGCPQVIVDVTGWFAGGSPAAGGFAGVAPARLWDTRKQPPCVGSVRQVKVAGVGGVPSNAGAVALNVTAVDAAASGYLTVWPSGQPRPATSNLNYRAKAAAANAVVMRVGTGGFVAVAASRGCPQVVVDVTGWHRAS
jgi:hypothetical protein